MNGEVFVRGIRQSSVGVGGLDIVSKRGIGFEASARRFKGV